MAIEISATEWTSDAMQAAVLRTLERMPLPAQLVLAMTLADMDAAQKRDDCRVSTAQWRLLIVAYLAGREEVRDGT